MRVGIHEPRQDQPALNVDDAGLGSGHRPNIRVRAYRDNLATPDGDPGDRAVLNVEGHDLPVQEDQIRVQCLTRQARLPGGLGSRLCCGEKGEGQERRATQDPPPRSAAAPAVEREIHGSTSVDSSTVMGETRSSSFRNSNGL